MMNFSFTLDEIVKLVYACNALNIHPSADTREDWVNWMLIIYHNRDSNIILVQIPLHLLQRVMTV